MAVSSMEGSKTVTTFLKAKINLAFCAVPESFLRTIPYFATLFLFSISRHLCISSCSDLRGTESGCFRRVGVASLSLHSFGKSSACTDISILRFGGEKHGGEQLRLNVETRIKSYNLQKPK